MRSFLAFVLGAAVATIFLTQKRPPRQIKSVDELREDMINRFLSNQDSAETKPTLH